MKLKNDKLEKLFSDLGLSDKESLVLRLLVTDGEMRMRKLVERSKLNRGTAYAIINDLKEKELVDAYKKNKVQFVKVLHPDNMRTFVYEKKKDIELAENNLKDYYPEILSLYNTSQDSPEVQFYDGIDGLKKVYNDLLAVKEDFLLIRSVYDNDHVHLGRVVQKQIKKQVRRKIKVRALTPIDEDLYYDFLKEDKSNLVERRVVNKDVFSLESQVMVYGNRVALTSMKDRIFTTVIINDSINQSFRVMFELMWTSSEKYHNDLLKKWKKKK